MADSKLVSDLLDNYVYQKDKLLKDAGCDGRLNVSRLTTLMRPRIEKMADLIDQWDVAPDMLMEALFAWAAHNRHPDGPMPNMLLSTKYIANALGHYLQVPYEAVMNKRGQTEFIKRTDYAYSRTSEELRRAGVTDFVTATSYPVEFRYMLALSSADSQSMFYMAQELLERMRLDRRVYRWLAHRGVSYERVAAHFNKIRNKQSP